MSKGLLTLQTDLKSLRYGNDKPYVTKDINNPPSSNQTGMQVTRRIDDLSRIAQMLVDRPGLKHLGNEALLRQVGVQDRIRKAVKNGGLPGGAILGEVLGTALTVVKVVGSTLVQVPVNGTGTHFLRGFNTNTYLQPINQGGISSFSRFFGAGKVEGAPSAIEGKEIIGEVANSNFYNKDTDVLSDKPRSPQILSLDLSKTDNMYLPSLTNDEVVDDLLLDAFLGDTVAPPRRTYLENTENKPEDTTKPPGWFWARSIPNRISGEIPDADPTKFKFSELGKSGPSTEWTGELGKFSNTYITQKKHHKNIINNVTKESRIILGDQGARNDEGKHLNSYWTTSPNQEEIDRLNSRPPSDGKVVGEKEGRDLIKFRFHILTADGKEKVLYFRAFLDSFADNFSAQWSPVKYLGRAEDFQVYGGFQRKITLSFKIAAATRSEMQPIYQKMVWLASATAPTYAGGGQFMRGTLTKVTVGDYIYELPGVLNSVNYNWNQDYPWDIAMLEPENQGVTTFEQELPMVMDCSIDFTPIHTFTPTTGLREYITTRLTEKGKEGIKDIALENVGIESEVTPIKDKVSEIKVPEATTPAVTTPPATAPTTAPFEYPEGIRSLPEFGPQLPPGASYQAAPPPKSTMPSRFEESKRLSSLISGAFG